MRDIELEEGEAYFVHDDNDDDENIDPDRDFSYIDKKIENVLGQYQKDFMGGISSETLGARFGGYGSFLPMQQRSPSALSGQRGQSHASSRSPHNVQPEQPRPNPNAAANNSFLTKPLSGSNAKNTQAVSQSGALPTNNQLKLQDSSESHSDKQQKEPMPQYSNHNSLKLRVKMTDKNALAYDKSAIYSGLGLDISPSSSPEDGHSDSHGASPGVQVKTDSPSYIIEIMTTLPFPDGELLSPLHDSWVHLTVKENNVETSIPAYAQAPVSINSRGNDCSEGKKEGSNVRKSKVKDSSKDKKIKKEEHQNVNWVNKNDISVLRGEFSMEKKKKKNEAECVEDESKKFQKRGFANDKVKEGVLCTVGSKQDKVYRKGYEMAETTSTDKDVAENDKHDGTYEEMKDCNTPKLSKKAANVKVKVRPQVEAGVLSGKKRFRSEEPSRESLVVGPSVGVGKSITPLKSKKGESELRKEVKKGYKVATNVSSNRKAKEVISKGVPEREIPLSPTKQKEKLGFKKKEVTAVVVPDITGGLIGGNSMEEIIPTEIVPHDDWVQCDKCHKWRLLPLDVNPESLPKVWICSMLTWLPGKNKCSVSEEETNAAYQPVGPTQLLNAEVAYPDVGPFVGPSGDIPHIGMSSQTSNVDYIASGSKRRDLLKTDLDASRRSDVRDPSASRKTGDVKPSKLEKKREADSEAYGVPKKTKRSHQHPIVNPEPASLSTVEAERENENHDVGPLEIARDYEKRPVKSSHVKVKDKTKNSNSERKVKDRAESTTSLGYHPGKVHQEMKDFVNGKNSVSEPNEERKERKSKSSIVQVRQGSEDKANSRTHSDGGGKHNVGSCSDNSRLKKGRWNNSQGSKRISNVGNSTEKVLDFGLSDNATTSSSSKVSFKGKSKASQVKCSPIGSISSSPFRVSKCDSDKGTSKLSSSKQLKPVFPTHGEDIRDIKSNFPRSYGADTTLDYNNSLRNKSVGKRPDTQITEDCKDGSLKVDHMIEDIGASIDKVAKSSNRLLHVNEGDSRITKVHDPVIGSEKEASYHSYGGGGVPENATIVDNVSLRHTQASAKPSHVESSVKKGSLHRAAKTALKEATNLKHSANRLKISGSTIESTEVFFQAALKFLHGASLLEPGNNESGRGGEMGSTEVYSTTATLCEYCAREYERGNNLASAALAYKCMEVAYMRVVYCNDVVASRDRMELQMAIRAAPQVESPSSSASDVDNLNNQVALDIMKDGHSSALDHRAHVISAENRPSFSRVLNFTEDINRAMEASRRSQIAFGAASPILTQAGKHVALSSIKTVIDFSFHDVEGFLHLVRLAMDALGAN